jgi:hypothetical protein
MAARATTDKKSAKGQTDRQIKEWNFAVMLGVSRSAHRASNSSIPPISTSLLVCVAHQKTNLASQI